MSDGELTPEATAALAQLEVSGPFHDDKLRRIKEQQLAYEALADPYADSMQWQSRLRPPILNHAVETAMTMLVDKSIDFNIKPAARKYSAAEWQSAMTDARAFEDVAKHQNRADHFDEFLRPWILQAAINRVSVAKTNWEKETFSTKSLVAKKLVPMFGPLSPVRLRETKVEKVLFEGPRTTVVDLRDFYWPESATHLDNADWAAHAMWLTPSQIEKKARANRGPYDDAAVQALVSRYSGLGAQDYQLHDDATDIERERERRGRKNGRLEVLELWDRSESTLFVIAARRFLLFAGDWPYWHGRFPFVAMSLAPFPFSIQGLSLVEKLAPLQEAYWDFLNQSRDNVKLMNNAIVLMASDFDGVDDFDYSPGAVNIVDNPQQVEFWQPNVNIAQLAAPFMQQLQSDMQNLAMGQPLSVPMSGRVTATEVATLSQIAQTAASKMKDQIIYGLRRIGDQRMQLTQQFVRDFTHVHGEGPDGNPIVKEVSPEQLQGTFEYVLDPDDESTTRAERRSEAQALLQVAVQSAPVFAQVGAPLNLKAFMDKFLDAYDVDNTDPFYSAKPQAPAGGAPGSQEPPGGSDQAEGAGPGGVPAGVTGPNSINPAVSPSAQASLSPGVMLARALASQGGAQNGGQH